MNVTVTWNDDTLRIECGEETSIAYAVYMLEQAKAVLLADAEEEPEAVH